jgi:glycosyl-4,4'-diaponeurosporenoate acyltransferase
MRIWILTADVLGWPVIHLSIAALILRLPLTKFAGNGFLYTVRSWERDGKFYGRWLAIRRWKSWLPDGAPWLGGFRKDRLRSRDREYLRRFMLETRRAECAHWCMLGCLPFFFLWNPPWACWVMTAYAVAANGPCVVAQRYNRAVLSRLISGKES